MAGLHECVTPHSCEPAIFCTQSQNYFSNRVSTKKWLTMHSCANHLFLCTRLGKIILWLGTKNGWFTRMCFTTLVWTSYFLYPITKIFFPIEYMCSPAGGKKRKEKISWRAAQQTSRLKVGWEEWTVEIVVDGCWKGTEGGGCVLKKTEMGTKN